MALHDYSSTLRSLNRIEPAKLAFREAFEVRKKVHQWDRKGTGGRVMLARMHASQGGFDRDAGKFEASFAEYQSAFDLLAQLKSEYPDHYEYHRELINVLIAQLEMCLQANDAVRGKPVWYVLHAAIDVTFDKCSEDTYLVSKAGEWLQPLMDHYWEGGHNNAARRAAQTTIKAHRRSLALAMNATPREEARRHNDIAWFLAVTPITEFRELDNAIQSARRAVALMPNVPDYHNTLGTALYYAGQYEESREVLLKSLKLRFAANMRATRERLLHAAKTLWQGEFDLAGREWQAALDLQRSAARIMTSDSVVVAMTLWQLGDQAQARHTLQIAVDPAADKFSTDGPELRRFLSEARTLIWPTPR